MHELHCLPDRQTVAIDETQTVLEALLAANIPVTHVCGGNAYCSTCRIMILEGADRCTPPTSIERALAKKLDFPVHVRLACQTGVSGAVSLRRMVLDNEDLDIVESQLSKGTFRNENSVALLFAAIRGANNFDEVNFHYDIVYIMGRYFHRMNRLVTQYGGVIENHIGGRFMAVFGLENEEMAIERAVWAALEMQKSVKELNVQLETLSYHPIDLSIGVHYGSIVQVPIDPSKPGMVTAFGDAVDMVSRVESVNKELGSEVIISETVFDAIRDRVTTHRTTVKKHKGMDYRLFEITAMHGEAPSNVAIAKNESQYSQDGSLSNRIFSFVQKFAGSWGSRK